MSARGTQIARMLLKHTAAGHAVGGAIKSVAKGIRGAVRFGGDVAEGAGVHRVVGNAAAAGGMLYAGDKAKKHVDNKIEQFKYEHGMYPYAG